MYVFTVVIREFLNCGGGVGFLYETLRIVSTHEVAIVLCFS